MRVGILTGGGDCPGLNAVIRAAVRKGIFHHNDEFVGFIEGWRGVVENKIIRSRSRLSLEFCSWAAPSCAPHAPTRARWRAASTNAWPTSRPTGWTR